MIHQLSLTLHLIGIIVWVGGMFFAYFCLRPAAVLVLDPPKRLPLWLATFAHFFRFTAIAVVVILASGFAMLLPVGFARAPVGWHVMLTLGLVMAAIFAYVYAVLYPRLRGHCQAASWPAAAAVLNTIRKWVGTNLLLALCTVIAAVSAR